VENDITRPIEEAVNTVSGIKTLRANSWEGRAGVYIDFELSTDMDQGHAGLARQGGASAPALPAKPRTRSSSASKATTAPHRQIGLTASGHDLRAVDHGRPDHRKRFRAWPASARSLRGLRRARS
jgi:multidrug efflux pump subunit AcrB